MAFLIGGANSKAADAYDIDNSLRFNRDDSPRLTDTTNATGDKQKFTVSAWVKHYYKGSGGQYIWNMYHGSPSDANWIAFGFNANSQFACQSWNSDLSLLSTARHRDPSAWYHVVLAVDTTQSTEALRARVYINGSEITVWSTENRPDQNHEYNAVGTSGATIAIGCAFNDGSPPAAYGFQEFYLADFYFIDGTQYAPGDFGETDEDSGIWKPKNFSGTFGSNGIKLEFGTSGTLGEDTSGNSDDLTSTNLAAVDQCTDTPTNNFCTINPLIPTGNYVYAEGYTKFTSGYDNIFAWANMGAPANSSTGWYCELRLGSAPVGGSGYGMGLGLADFTYAVETHGLSTDGAHPLGSTTMFGLRTNYAYDADYSLAEGTSGVTDLNVATQVGQVMQLAWKDSKIYFGVNNTWYAADAGTDGDPAGGSNQSHTVSSTYNSDLWMPMVWTNIGGIALSAFNFGNPSWALTSGESDANGYGNFEYAPPTGFYALCTKNLAEFG